jgi:hypothetical protein
MFLHLSSGCLVRFDQSSIGMTIHERMMGQGEQPQLGRVHRIGVRSGSLTSGLFPAEGTWNGKMGAGLLIFSFNNTRDRFLMIKQ